MMKKGFRVGGIAGDEFRSAFSMIAVPSLIMRSASQGARGRREVEDPRCPIVSFGALYSFLLTRPI